MLSKVPSASAMRWTIRITAASIALAATLTCGALLLESVVCPAPWSHVCQNHLKYLGLALHNYHDDWGAFPPSYIADGNGEPMHSWRVLLLPYLDQQQFYEEYRFDEPWDGPNNRAIAEEYWGRYGSPFRCPMNPSSSTMSYVAVVDPATLWPPGEPRSLDDVRDRLARTILLLELKDSDIRWMEPRDVSLDELLRLSPAELGHVVEAQWPWRSDRVEVNVLMADGSLQPLGSGDLRELLTIGRQPAEQVK